jgi:D-arabinose 1-dehydrogenase-like Zn-dependent alcohol dehydrogenase
MRTMILTEQKRVEEWPLTNREMDAPRAGPGEVRVKVSVCAVCRTDIHIVEGDLALHKMPVIPGHQIVGRVDETGDDVIRLRVGAVELSTNGLSGLFNQCENNFPRFGNHLSSPWHTSNTVENFASDIVESEIFGCHFANYLA